jgi:hypothetical protein
MNMYVMFVRVLRLTNCYSPCHLALHMLLYSLFTLMFGVLLYYFGRKKYYVSFINDFSKFT